MCVASFYEIIWSVFLLLMLSSMDINNKELMLLKWEDFIYQVPKSPPPFGHILDPRV
jgi:hypothetical protein